MLRNSDFDKLFIALLHRTLYFFAQKHEFLCDVTFYLHSHSAGGTKIYIRLVNQTDLALQAT